MAIKLIITDLGIAEVINAEQSGTAPTKITQVGFGTGVYTPDPAQTSLQDEFKRLSTIAGGAFGPNQIHVTVSDGPTPDDYSVHEIGLYLESGTLFAVYSQTSPIIFKTAESNAMLAVDIELTGDLDPDLITFGDANFQLNSATEEREGLIRKATVQEAIDGVVDDAAVTPEGLEARISSIGGVAKAGEIDSLDDPPQEAAGLYIVQGTGGVVSAYVIELPVDDRGTVRRSMREVWENDGVRFEKRLESNIDPGSGWGGWYTDVDVASRDWVNEQIPKMASKTQAEDAESDAVTMSPLRTKDLLKKIFAHKNISPKVTSTGLSGLTINGRVISGTLEIWGRFTCGSLPSQPTITLGSDVSFGSSLATVTASRGPGPSGEVERAYSTGQDNITVSCTGSGDGFLVSFHAIGPASADALTYFNWA